MAVCAPCLPAGAQDDLDDRLRTAPQRVVVTGNAVPLGSLRSSVAETVLGAETIRRSGSDSAADLLRSVPGLLVQSSGGEGNANIGARGLPLSGGAKFALFMEDGLPVLAFGDLNFATADGFVRIDPSLARLEVVRGGSAATLASNAPGAVFNLVSRTGDVAGGSLSLSTGLGFARQRVDFGHGAAIDDVWRYHVGGYYRVGEGARTIGYTGERGGQIKANLTRRIGEGHVRLHLKLLDDRAPVSLPVPLSITGSTADPIVASLPGFDARTGALQTPALQEDLAVDRDGRIVRTDPADGYRSLTRAVGYEVDLDVGAGWRLEQRARLARISGGFVGPYPAEVTGAAALAAAIGGPGATLRYATGPRAGQPFDTASPGGNGLAVRTHLFNTTLGSLDHLVQDLRLTRSFGSGERWLSATAGFYTSRQTIDQDWHWNTYLQEARGSDSALLDVRRADGSLVTQRGLQAYGEPFWGDCCVHSYRLHYDTQAPYLALNAQQGGLNVDASVRLDVARGSGHYAGAGAPRAIDVDGDGTLQPPETRVAVVDPATALPVDYRVHYHSHSLGASLALGADAAVFSRLSRGGRANADRALFGGGIRADGSIAHERAVNTVDQQELGLKSRWRQGWLQATLFSARTRLSDQDITSTTERFSRRTFRAHGIELEGSWRAGPLEWLGGMTWTHGRISADEITPERVGERVNPRFMFNLAPTLRLERSVLGLNVIGISSFPSTRGGLPNPGFVQVNGFAEWTLAPRWTLALAGNNLFNRIGITELPNAAAGVTADGVNSGRSIAGRTLQASIRHEL